MGNFKQAITDWLNILKRFRNNTRFDEQELTVVRDALLGVELAVGRFSNNAILEDITALTETFASEYIGFELSLIVLKSYAKDSRWAELINAAEAMRTEYPKRKNEEISLLMASGLMALNQYESADSLLLETYNQHKSPAALVKWAELDVLGNDYRSAFDKYSIAYRDSAVFEIWLNLLECSSQLDYFEFETLWEYRNKYPSSYSTANKFLLRYLYNRGRLVEAISLADELLNTSLSQYDHALAFLIGGLIELKREDYPAAFSSLNKTIILFPEFRDIQMEAVVNLVSGLFRSGARTDAIVYYRRYQHVLDEDASQTLKTMLGLAE
jgi:tetratricopeptide (TPR) repeat protein